MRGCRVCATHKQRQQRKRIELDEPTQYSHNCTWPRCASSKRRCVCACHHHVLVSSLTACIPCLLRCACACCVPLLVRPVSPGPAGGGCHTITTYNITHTLHRCVRACCVRVYVASNLFENTPLALFNRESAPSQQRGLVCNVSYIYIYICVESAAPNESCVLNMFCVCCRVYTFAAETRLNQKQNLIVAAFRGISAKQEVNNQAACTHIRHTPCVYVYMRLFCYYPKTELSDVLLLLCVTYILWQHARSSYRCNSRKIQQNTTLIINAQCARVLCAYVSPFRGRTWRTHTHDSRCHTIEIWLILPVVICLFQGLSHACLRITAFAGICAWLITSDVICRKNLAVSAKLDNLAKRQANT